MQSQGGPSAICFWARDGKKFIALIIQGLIKNTVLLYFQLILPSTMIIPSIKSAEIAEDGATSNEKVLEKADKLCKELNWYIAAQLGQKKSSGSFPNWEQSNFCSFMNMNSCKIIWS